MKVTLSTLLPIAALKKMRGLVECKLKVKGWKDPEALEGGILSALPQLTCLDLSNNDLCIIPTLTALTNLETLDLSNNMMLQLRPEYLHELRRLSRLRRLNLKKGNDYNKMEWSINSFKFMKAIEKELPDLVLKL